MTDPSESDLDRRRADVIEAAIGVRDANERNQFVSIRQWDEFIDRLCKAVNKLEED